MTERLRTELGQALGQETADLVLAAQAALAGGRAALAHYGSSQLEVADKREGDPVTAADHAADAAITAVLGAHRPGDPVLSEESAPSLAESTSSRLWVVDPLDGTKEFIACNGEFSVMVGLAKGGRARLGAVYQPAVDRLYLGGAAGGSWEVANAQADPAVRALETPTEVPARLRFVRSRSHPDDRLARLEGALGEIQIVKSGSVGIKCALIATGEADLYVHPVPYLKEWDTCAPEAVLRGAGGRVTDCAGRPLSYGKAEPRQLGGIFAGCPDAWSRAESAVREAAADLFADGEPAEYDLS